MAKGRDPGTFPGSIAVPILALSAIKQFFQSFCTSLTFQKFNYELEISITQRNRERKILLFQFKSTSRSFCKQAQNAKPHIIYSLIDSEKRSQSENSLRDRTLVDLN